ncbi:nitrogen regulation protein NR(II) [Paenibacillus sp. GCM10027627]|uniref:two-component system sensor histidine kinase NtrB n=1 Tax=unclassified Paenibacillus TaxID=185978 RepID=UPI00363DCD58
MLKDMLLQFFLSVLPVFTFLLWHDKERGWKGFKPFIAITSSISIILCLLTTATFQQYEINFQIVPYLIGSLYGGYRAMAGLTLLYIFVRIPFLDHSEEIIGFLIFLFLFILLLWVSIRPFQLAATAKKEKIGLLIIGVLLACSYGFMGVLMMKNDVLMSFALIMDAAMAAIGMMLGVWLSIYIIESIKEKQLLHYKVIQLSASYRNEVEKLHQFIGKAPIAVMMVDRDGMITQVNDECLNLLGMQPGPESIDKLKLSSFRAVFLSEMGDTCIHLLELALQGESESTVMEMKDGGVHLFTTVTLRDVANHYVIGAALIAQDVTELRQLRDELGRMERLSLVGQMAASITHEIRNPMAVIRGFVQLIQERSPQSQYEYFRIIMEELDRANLIISDFLSLAQNRELKMEAASLNNSINDLVPLLSADANLRGQSLEVELCKELPDMMLNDREVKQMLLNLARNGMEAMEEKGVLRIKTAYEDGEISVHISDEGVGITQEKMKHLFEPFFTTKTRGTGLGLPLCLSIAERHHGRIDVQSKEGEGTTFVVTFNIREEMFVHNNL